MTGANRMNLLRAALLVVAATAALVTPAAALAEDGIVPLVVGGTDAPKNRFKYQVETREMHTLWGGTPLTVFGAFGCVRVCAHAAILFLCPQCPPKYLVHLSAAL